MTPLWLLRINYSYILVFYIFSWQISVGTKRNTHFWSSLYFNCSSQTLKHWILLTNSKAYPKLQHVSSKRIGLKFLLTISIHFLVDRRWGHRNSADAKRYSLDVNNILRTNVERLYAQKGNLEYMQYFWKSSRHCFIRIARFQHCFFVRRWRRILSETNPRNRQVNHFKVKVIFHWSFVYDEF